MRRRNIAVLMTAADSESQADELRGIEEYAKSHGCNIAVFLWFTGAFETKKHNLGEANIVNLPDLKLFDGIIVVANALHIEENREMIENLLEEVTCPVIGIGCKIGDHYMVRTDNYTAMRELVEHFVLEHKLTDIHFVKGIEGNEDAEARFRAYVDVLEENNIPLIQKRISDGDFYITGAEKAAMEIMDGVLPLPQAIICANDVTAITISDILMKNGYRVPEDVMISGYDYSIEAQNHNPRITSVRSRFRDIGKRACEIILNVLDGQEMPKDNYLPDEIVLDESCGCVKRESDSPASDIRSEHGEDISKRIIIHQLIMTEKNFAECQNLEDWVEAIRDFIPKVDVTEFYCCVNEGFEDRLFEMDVMEQEEMTLAQRLSYTPYVHPILAYKHGNFIDKKPFRSKYAFDEMFQDSDTCKMYVFSPLHYLERTFGYFVFVDSDFTIANQLYISWLISVGNAVENIRKQRMLQNAMKRLGDMYVRDPLTGVYNRFGLDRYFSEIKQKCMISRIRMQFSFADLDNLKSINDIYGHEVGDEIISAAARILQEEAPKGCVARYGGDEFVVLGTAIDREEVEAYWSRVQRRIDAYNGLRTGAKLSLSYGYNIFEVEGKTSLDDCILVVDRTMYEQKRAKKSRNN